MYGHFFKRFCDMSLALFALLFLSAALLVIMLAIKIDSRGTVFFKQQRIGKDKKIFKILKFRTMSSDTPKNTPTHMLENPETYITKVGKFLRKTSLDELPQLFNILSGKMSFVGPRPALYNQDDLVLERDKYRANDVRPGLTGLAQISGRDELEIPLKARLDGEYVQKITFCGDLKILLKTFASVLRSDGVKEGKSNDGDSSNTTNLTTNDATSDENETE